VSILRVTLIGMGNVGSALAFGLVIHPEIMCDIDLIDIDEQKLNGEVADLIQAREITRKPIDILSISEPRESDIYVLCAGKNSDNRESLFEINLPIITHYSQKIAQVRKEDSALLMVTNPSTRLAKVALDYMPYVIPMGNMLDNARLRLCQINCPHEKPEIQKKYLEAKNGKGYTNFAPATEALLVIQRLINMGR